MLHLDRENSRLRERGKDRCFRGFCRLKYNARDRREMKTDRIQYVYTTDSYRQMGRQIGKQADRYIHGWVG